MKIGNNMNPYIPRFKEVTFRGSDKILADQIASAFDEYSSFYRRDPQGLIEAIAESLHLGMDEVEYYLKALRLI